MSFWLLRLLPAWPRPGLEPVVWNSQITQGNFQLCVARVSFIVCVIAFLVAHQYDVCARPGGPSVVSLPVQDVGFRNDMFCTVVRCRTLGWLSRLVNADFVRSGSRGSV